MRPMPALVRDLRDALRVSLKTPGLTLLAAATLGIAIAANAVVFGWIDTVLVKPLPGAGSADRLAVFETMTASGEFLTTSYPDYRDYRDHLRQIDGLALAQPRAFSLEDHDLGEERAWGELVSGNYFAVLGVRPALGRVFSPEEYGDRQGGYPVAVIGYRLWQRRFGGDPAVIGRTLRINRQPLTIVGVAAPEFRGSVTGLNLEIWVPAMMATSLNFMPEWMLGDRKTRSFLAIARLQQGVAIERARAETAALALEIARAHPATNQGITATLLPLWKGHFGAQSILLSPLRILMAVCGLVLLIACANVANLLLARAVARRRELALRLTLGSGRVRLARLLLTESLIPGVGGALFGIWLAEASGGAMGYLMPAGSLPVALGAGVNLDVLIFTVLITLAACMAAGLAPAIHASRTELNEALREGGRGSTGATRSRNLRRVLVGAEIALALVAIIGAGLFTRSFQHARTLDPGFDATNVLVSHLYLATGGYSEAERKLLCRRLRDRLEGQTGVALVTYADSVPLALEGGSWEDLQIEGYVPGVNENLKILRNVVAPGYFELMRIKLLDGRDFNERDTDKSEPVMVVTDAFARRFFPGRNPLGARVRGWGKWFRIIGVARDTKYRAMNEEPQAYFYVAFNQVYRADMNITLYVRTAGDPATALAAMRREIRATAPSGGTFHGATLEDEIGAALFPQKVAASLMSVLGGIALLLAAAGLYSVMAYSVTQRQQEIGIRVALGARPGQVVGLVVRQGLTLAGAGLAAGLCAAVLLTRFASSLLIGISATDPPVFLGSVLFLSLVAAAASYIPARRAARIDPGTSLRSQ